MKLADIMADMKGEMGQEWEKKGFQMPKFDIGAMFFYEVLCLSLVL